VKKKTKKKQSPLKLKTVVHLQFNGLGSKLTPAISIFDDRLAPFEGKTVEVTVTIREAIVAQKP
jgi:hypothetical protein